MKKAVSIVLSLLLVLSLAACGNSDADRSDNTKDGVIGDGLGDDMRDLGDDVRDLGDDIFDGSDRNATDNRDGNVNGGANGNTGTTGTNGANGSAGMGVGTGNTSRHGVKYSFVH